MFRRIWIFIAILCVVMVVYQIVAGRNETAILRERGKMAVGKTVSFRDVFKSGNRVTYVFKVNGKLYQKEDEKTEIDPSHFEKFVNRNFPVIYDPDNPGTSRILLLKSDFEQISLAIPDTLKTLVNSIH